MFFSPAVLAGLSGTFTVLKASPVNDPAARRVPHVVEPVSAILLDIERNGLEAVQPHARQLHGCAGGNNAELSAAGTARTQA